MKFGSDLFPLEKCIRRSQLMPSEIHRNNRFVISLNANNLSVLKYIQIYKDIIIEFVCMVDNVIFMTVYNEEHFDTAKIAYSRDQEFIETYLIMLCLV